MSTIPSKLYAVIEVIVPNAGHENNLESLSWLPSHIGTTGPQPVKDTLKNRSEAWLNGLCTFDSLGLSTTKKFG